MNTGTVKWFDAKKGYGFISDTESDDDKDYFVPLGVPSRFRLSVIANQGFTNFCEWEALKSHGRGKVQVRIELDWSTQTIGGGIKCERQPAFHGGEYEMQP